MNEAQYNEAKERLAKLQELKALKGQVSQQEPRPLAASTLTAIKNIMEEGGAIPSQEAIRGYADAAKEGLADALLRRDRRFDTGGVSDFGLRSELSRAETDLERAKVLNRRVGAGNWTKDNYKRLALKRDGQKPVLIDDPSNPFELGDIADMTGVR